MRQRILRVILVSCLLLTSLFIGGAACAQDEELPEPGLTPDSPFYFLDKWGKDIGMFFAFSSEAKARKALEYAEERLAEVRAMAAKNRVREMEQAANDYEGFMATVHERLETAARYGMADNVSERVSLATAKHLRILDKIKDELPEQSRAALTRARTASMNGQVNALRVLAQDSMEKAIEIAADTIENRLERARVRATENVTADAEEALDYAARIIELEEELTALAEEQGIDVTAIIQRLAQSTANRLDVLSEVYEKVPENARQGIANAIENSVRKYERAVEKLTEENAAGDIPDVESVINRIQEEVRERVKITTAEPAPDSDNITVEVQVRVENQEQNRVGQPEAEQQTTSTVESEDEGQNTNQKRSP
jgi:hypothetical protein